MLVSPFTRAHDDHRAAAEPTGVIREACLQLLDEHIEAAMPLAERMRHLERGLRACLQAGLTAVQTNDPHAWPAYLALQQRGAVPVRVFLTIPHAEMATALRQADRTAAERTVPLANDRVGLVSCHRCKLFADGSLGAETAALRAPYAGGLCDHAGVLVVEPSVLLARIGAAHRDGYRVEIHAIGDRAAAAALDALAAAGVPPAARPILTHCQVLGADLVERMHRAGVVANVQPSFVRADARWAARRLGAGSTRLAYAYAWRTLLRRGVHLAGGSDAPVESCAPLTGLYDAIFREPAPHDDDDDEPPDDGISVGADGLRRWHADQCLSFAEAVHLYTAGAAYCAGADASLGRLLPGYRADFTVLDQAVWDDPRLLRSARILQVWVDGRRRL